MDIGVPARRGWHILNESTRMLAHWRPLVVALCLMGIGFLLWFYVSQNSTVARAYQELSAQRGFDGQPTPLELVDLTHQACLLDVRINNVQSFLQPMSNTLSSGGWCGNYVRVFISFAAQEGYPAHKFHIQSGGRSHTLAEVYYQGKWRMIDPFLNHVYLLPSGEMATYHDIRQDLTLLDSPTSGGVDDERLRRIYRNYEPKFPALYRDAPNFYAGLDGSALYHNIFVVLSYPLDLFYEGGRRPILPAWLDRPELLGTYALSVVVLIVVAPSGVRSWNNYRRSCKGGSTPGQTIDQ